MSDFTISSASTIMNCRYPFRGDVTFPPEAATDEDRDLGNVVHACGASEINTGEVAPDLAAAGGAVWLVAKAWIGANWKPTWVAEPAYAWDPAADTARLLGVDIARQYAKHGKLPHEKAGTLDVASVEGDAVYVYEFGTGFDVEHKQEQLRLQCAVAARAHGKLRAVGQVVKFGAEGAYPSQPVTFDEFELAAILGEFDGYLAEVEGSVPTPGEHCSRCNLAPVCPAATAIVQSVIPEAALVRPGWGLTIANADHAAWLLAHARLVAAAAEAVKDAVKAYVPKDGLLLEDGSLLVEGTRNMPRRDNKKLETLARTLGATDEQVAGCDYIALESSGLKIKRPAAAKAPRKRKAA